MKIFKIIDENNSQTVARVEAQNGKIALKKFMRSKILSTGLHEIHMTPFGNWELSTSFGAYFYAVETC